MSRKTKAAEFALEGWDIQITGRNVLVTDAMKDYAMEKISKIERFNKNRILEVAVIMDIQRFEQRVDITIRVDNLKIRSQGITDNMYASIDMAVDKLMEQLRRYKSRIQDYHANNHEEVAMQVDIYAAPSELEVINEEIEDANVQDQAGRFEPHKIVAQETRSLKTLTNGDAIFKMELSKDHFLIFRSEEDRKLKVIYRRSDGNYSIITIGA